MRNFLRLAGALALMFVAAGAALAQGSDVFESVLAEYRGNTGYRFCEIALHDIDANGADELLVRYSDGTDDFIKIYTYAGGTVNEIGEFWSRKRLLLDGGGNIYIIGSNGADSTIFEMQRIAGDGKSLVTVEAWESNGPIYTHISIDGKRTISEDEFQTASNRFLDMTTDIVDALNWQTLSAN